MNKTSTTKLEEIKRKAIPILKESGVSRSAIFGSYARGEETEISDIDFLVEFKAKKNLLDLVDLKIKLEDIFGLRVDVLTYRSVSPYLRDIIEKDKVDVL